MELAEALGGLPLALEQAAAYMQATGTPLARYLGWFRDRQAVLLARGEVAGHREHVAATLGLALSGLGDDSAAAGLVQAASAFLAPEAAQFRLLLAEADIRMSCRREWPGWWGRCWGTRWRRAMRWRGCGGIRWRSGGGRAGAGAPAGAGRRR